MNLSGSGSAAGAAVFAGYGITADEYGYDDYSDVDVRGRIAVILRHEPQEYENSSVFEGRVYTEHSQMFRKALNARAHGAIGVLFVNDSANHSGPENLERLTALPSPGAVGIPFVQVSAAIVERWFEAAGRNFADAQASIDRDLQPQSFEFPSTMQFSVRADISSEQKPVANVAAYLPGLTDEYVVVGAHYDHLGHGEQYSLAPEQTGTLHPGADDNASGTAALLSLARWFSSQPKMKRGILFLAFAGEEIGLLGSTWYTTHPLLPLEKAVAMINMDMIGRLRDRKLTVGGTSSGNGLRNLVSSSGKGFPFELLMDDLAVYGSSDHTTFKARGIPVLFFFTGLHSDYHRPTDTADRIDAKATAQVVNLVGSVTARIAQLTERIAFVRTHTRAAAPKSSPGISGYSR
jgi:hypothetical protein